MATEEQVQQWIQEALNAEHEREQNAWIAAASIKLPQFWPDKTRVWFAQAEAQFETKGIMVEKTKFNHVVQMLDSKTATQAMNVIEIPDATNPYMVLKQRLTKAFTLSDSEKAARIIDMSGLGDRTPSQCLADMLQLVPQDEVADPGFLFREHFLRQLPSEVCTQLAQTTKIGTAAKTLRELADEADRYFTSTGARISAITASSASTDSRLPLIPETSTETEIFAISGRGGTAPRGSQGLAPEAEGDQGKGSEPPKPSQSVSTMDVLVTKAKSLSNCANFSQPDSQETPNPAESKRIE